MSELHLFLAFLGVLVGCGGWYAIRAHRRQRQLRDEAMAKQVAHQILASIQPVESQAPLTTGRFFVCLTFYEGDNASLARKAWEAQRILPAPTNGRLEFWDGQDCRGRYPE